MRRKREPKAMLFKILVGKNLEILIQAILLLMQRKREGLFLTFMVVRVFLNYRKLHMNCPTNSLVQLH